MSSDIIRQLLKSKGLRVTPQRIAIYEAVLKLSGHPSAERIIDYTKANHPNISIATIYKILDSLVENNILTKVKTENGFMRYDPVMQHHHHLYCSESDRIEDYNDEHLDKIISEYFKKKKIENFEIQNIKLQITGKFRNNKD